MKIDAHQHFWRYGAAGYPWIDASMKVLRRDWLPGDLLPLLDAQGIDRCIAVQARAGELETDFLLKLARQEARIAGVIGWVDLCADDLAQRLQQWEAAPNLLGFRHQLQDEADVPGFLENPRFRRGVRLLQRDARIYEVLVFARQLGSIPDFCAACDSHWLVLDHLGKPAIRDRDHRSWRRDLLPLAAMPHMICKLSGLVTEANPGELSEADLASYLDTALELFGAERLMFGSDWPVCLLAASYAQVAEIIERWAGRLSEGEQQAVWGETARRVYGLAL
jgi:L-fuconolactonase